MILFVPNTIGIYRFVEQISVTKEILSSLKFTKNIDVARRHGATKSINSMDLTREKANRNCGMLKGGKSLTDKVKIYLYICVLLFLRGWL